MSSAETFCPRCQVNLYTPYGAGPLEPGDPPYPALSRLDNETYICSPCGRDEALRDMQGHAPIPHYEWPVKLAQEDS